MQRAPVTSKIASRVRQLRASRGWTAKRLAEECARAGTVLSRATIAKIESGHRQAVTADELKTLARVFGVTTDFLLKEDDTDRPVTILHLSDLEIGVDCLFGDALDAADADALRTRLHDDLDLLSEEIGSRPDLIIVTGDIAASGARSEFEIARSVLADLVEHLGLQPDRLIVVPGDHDVTRKACQAYFASCEADDLEPQEPYWPKWRHFSILHDSLHEGPATGTPAGATAAARAATAAGMAAAFDSERQPWTFLEVPELNVVVCGLNSTIADSHREADHYGWIGHQQAAWFAERLRASEAAGWLRIGAVHHNVRGTAQLDTENLRDTDTLERLLGQRLNVLFHGRPGAEDGMVSYLNSGLPVLAAGRGVVPAGERPAVNEYQVVQISADGLTRWIRRYDPDGRRWVAGTRVPTDDDSWSERVVRSWHAAHQAFPPTVTPVLSTTIGAWEPAEATDDRPPGPRRPPDLLDRIAEVCAVRYTNAVVHRIDRQPPYLRVTYLHNDYPQQVRIGAIAGDFDESDVHDFLASAHDVDAKLPPEIVYESPSPPRALRARIRRQGIRLRSFVEFQGLLDLQDYVAAQTERLVNDRIYPPTLYVPQRYRDITGADRTIRESLVDDLLTLFAEEDGRFVLLLGDFGRGKTFALHELARRIPDEPPKLIPVLIDLRALDKAHSVEGLVAAHLANHGHEVIDLRAFRYMLRQGRIVLLFDGFDELVTRVTYDRAADHLETLLSAAQDKAKIIVASRTQHFQTHQQVLTALGERVGLLPHRRVLSIADFSRSQVRAHLVNRYNDEHAADTRLQLISSIEDLLGLVRNPRMLSFVADLGQDRLNAVLRASPAVSAASLYREILNSWLDYEEDRTQGIPGAPVGLSVDDLWIAVVTLALRLWETNEPLLELRELTEVAETLTGLAGHKLSPRQTVHAMGAGSLLVRTEDGLFGFIHTSVMEWLVASEIARQLNSDEPPELLSKRPLSQLTVDFVCDLADPSASQRWIGEVLSEGTGTTANRVNEVARANAVKLAARLRTPWRADLHGASLRGENLSDRDLGGVDLTGADLTEARLVGTNLAGANLTGVNLTSARLDRAVLDRATLTGATLSGARLLGTSLRGVEIASSNWRHAALVGAVMDDTVRAAPELYGAAIAPDQPVEVGLAPSAVGVSFGFEVGRLPQPVDYAPDGATVAIGGNDGGVIICDTATGLPLRTLPAHLGRAYLVAYSPDGTLLATGGEDRRVRLWNTWTGACERSLPEHQDWVWPVVFSPDSELLATGNADGTVRLWNPRSGKVRVVLSGHADRVWTMAFQPSGPLLAVGDNDGVRLWERAGDRGRVHHDLSISDSPVFTLAFHPAGDQLATGGADGVIRLWDCESGELREELPGHGGRVYTLAFHPDGALLISGDTKGEVRIWDRTAGWSGRTVTRHTGAAYRVTFSPDGETIASGDSDGVVRLCDAHSNQLHELNEHRASVWPMVFRPDGEQLATSSNDGTARLWNLRSARVERTLRGHGRRVGSVGFSADGTILASAGNDGVVRLWHPRTGQLHRTLGGVARGLTAATLSPTGTLLATPGTGGGIHLWDVATGKYERELNPETDHVWAQAFSPDSDELAIAKDDDTVELRYASTGRCIQVYSEHRGRVRSVAFSPDCTTIATGCDDRTVRLWHKDSDASLATMRHTDRVYSVAFNAEGTVLASASNDRTACLWDVRTGERLRAIKCRSGRLWSVAFCPTGSLLATAGDDGVVNLWDWHTGDLAHALTGHNRRVLSVAFSPDGELLASGSDDGTIRLWSVADRSTKSILLGLDDGWAAVSPDGRYKSGGDTAGQFWHTIGMRRFEPGELDEYLPAIRRIPFDEEI